MSTPEIQVHILESTAAIEEALEYIAQYEGQEVAVDVETDSSVPQLAELWGFGFSFDEEEAFYVPLRYKDRSYNNEISKEALQVLLNRLATNYKVIGHNFIYDYLVLKKYSNIDFKTNLHCDTILLKHTVDEERPHGLKESCIKYLGPWADKAQDKLYSSIEANGGSTKKDDIQMWKADTSILAEYCGWDCALTFRLYKVLSQKLKEEKLENLFYNDEVMPLYKEVTIPMNERGFPIDVEHFQNLHKKIVGEIRILQDNVQDQIAPLVEEFVADLLNEEFPAKTTGNFPKVLAEVLSVELPKNKENKITLSRKLLEKTLDPNSMFAQFMLEDCRLPQDIIQDVQVRLFFNKYPEKNYIFNLGSNDHLGNLIYNILGEEVKHKTDSGKPSVEEEVLDEMRDRHEWLKVYSDMKKLMKLESTYIRSILEKHIDGVIYPSFQQFGTTSGRYSCVQPNLQNLPRVKDEESDISPLVLSYSNEIKAGFISGKGYKLVDADQSALEPRAFACAAKDPSLQEVFSKGHDLYSSIAIKTFGLYEYSADKKAPNYLGNHKKEARQKAKVIALAVVYGAEAGRLRSILGCTTDEAQEIINSYLNAYPMLRKYMEECDSQLLTKGYVISRFGRIRHVPKAKMLFDTYGKTILNQRDATKKGLKDIYWELKNMRNLAKNHPIQATASYIINKASINIARKFKQEGIEGGIVAQIHDQITCLCKEEEAEKVKALMKDCMENTVKLEIPFIADPNIGDRWSETK